MSRNLTTLRDALFPMPMPTNFSMLGFVVTSHLDRHMRRFIVAVISAEMFLSAIARPQTDGSIAFVVWTQDEIAVAADSRQNHGTSYSDTGCKIATFGNKLMFVATGRSSAALDPSWDAYAVAPKEYRRITGKGATNRLASRVADAWGERVQIEFQRLGSRALGGLDDNFIITGLFSDFEKDGSLLIAVSEVTYELLPSKRVKVSSHTKLIPTSSPEANAFHLGHSEIIDAINNPRTPQEAEWQRQYRAVAIEWSDKLGRDDAVGEVIGYVDATIQHLPKNRRNSEGVPFSVVGYPVASIRMKRGKGVEWIARGKCSSQQ